jgi:hypothetical protein
MGALPAAIVVGVALLAWPLLSEAQDRPLDGDEYLAALVTGTGYWTPLYQEYGRRFRQGRIVAACGYRREADALETATETQFLKKLNQLTREADAAGKFRRTEALVMAREVAHAILIGYKFGLRDGVDILGGALSAPAQEGPCQDVLRRVREWLSEGPQ